MNDKNTWINGVGVALNMNLYFLWIEKFFVLAPSFHESLQLNHDRKKWILKELYKYIHVYEGCRKIPWTSSFYYFSNVTEKLNFEHNKNK